MSYLIIDLEKPSTKLKNISAEAGAVYLFTKRKRTRKVANEFAASHRAAKAVHIQEKLAKHIAIKLKKILKDEPTAGIVVVSKRKKVAKAIDKLLNRFPDAEIVLLDKLEKNTLKQAKKSAEMETVPATEAVKTETPVTQVEPAQTEVAKTESAQTEVAEPAKAEPANTETAEAADTEPTQSEVVVPAKTDAQLEKSAPIDRPLDLPLSPPVTTVVNQQPEITTSQQTETEESQKLQNALNLLKKNCPKKKAALLQSLVDGLHIDEAAATQLIAELEKIEAIHIDVAENVKYHAQ